ncbi:MAG: flagellar hook-length control protein FliK [Amphiplicatus sp.]
MIESVTSASLSLPKRAASDAAEAPGFSYALASASLEASAGAALKAFGAKEGAAEVAAAPARETTVQSATENALTRTASPQSGERNAQKSAPDPAAPPASAPALVEKPAVAGPAVVAVASAQAAVLASPLAAQQAAPASAARVESAAREIQARGANEGTKPKAVVAARPEQPAASEFARLLARKLEGGATAFDLRLDPPELGRVAARLTLGDDGKAQLALTFDSQTALDLFRRDEAGLREMLLASGFDLGAGDLAFSFEAPGEPAALSPDIAAAPAAASFASSQALPYLASYSRGVVDLFT